jgi:Flp pilus assembly protein TadG
MFAPRATHPASSRHGSATVELAIVLPLLVFLFLVTVDYCRLFHFAQVVSNCARSGALYASDPGDTAQFPYASLDEAARADAPETLRPYLTVTSTTQTTATGPEVVVTVSYPFTSLTRFPCIPHAVTLSRTVRMPVAPVTPK